LPGKGRACILLAMRDFHAIVKEIGADFVALADGPQLPEAKLEEWFERLKTHEDRKDICIELIVLAGRFQSMAAQAAMLQMITLAVAAGDVDAAVQRLAAQGTDLVERDKILQLAQNRQASLSGGLAPPNSAGAGFRPKLPK
jgi:hypothetical protein